MNFPLLSLSSVPGWLVPALLVGIAILLLVIIVLIAGLYKRVRRIYAFVSAPPPAHPGSAGPPPAPVQTGGGTAAVVTGVSGGRPGLTGDLDRLAREHRLDGLTISTRDGLVVASTGIRGPEDAAYFSELYRNGEKITDPHVQVFPIRHGSDDLVGIIRVGKRLAADELDQIAGKAGIALSRWV
jgi:hypothetical protein